MLTVPCEIRRRLRSKVWQNTWESMERKSASPAMKSSTRGKLAEVIAEVTFVNKAYWEGIIPPHSSDNICDWVQYFETQGGVGHFSGFCIL